MKNIAPPYSFINSLDFDSTLQLIQFLVKISKDDALYASYFWWKDYYEVRNDHKDRAQSCCDLCAKLNNPNEPSKYYDDMYKWWIQDSNCHQYSKDLSLNYQPPRDYNGWFFSNDFIFMPITFVIVRTTTLNIVLTLSLKIALICGFYDSKT